MASNNFTYAPASGNGTTNVSVSVSGNNTTHADKNATLTFSNGTGSKSVTLKQKYIPYFNDMPSILPASGGSFTITPRTEYDIAFRDVPSWITITLGGTPIAENQRIPASTASGSTFTMTASENTGATRSVSTTFKMSHYIGDVLQTTNFKYIDVTQESGAAPVPSQDDINVLVKFVNYTPRNNWSVVVGITSYNGTYNSRSYALNVLNPEDEDYITVALNPGGTTNLTVEVVADITSGTAPSSFAMDRTFKYAGDVETDPSVVCGDSSFFYATYSQGEDMTIELTLTVDPL